MLQSTESAANQYRCICKDKILDKKDIIPHLRMGSVHKITKVTSPKIQNFKNSINTRIEEIFKTQIEIQKSSIQLIQNIIKNTSNANHKLSELIKVYRNLLYNPPIQETINFEKFEIINVYKMNPSIFSALIDNFQQSLVVEKSGMDIIRNKVKTHANEIFKNHLGSMKCMAVFSNKNHVVTGGADGAIRVWNLDSKSQTWFILKHNACINSLALGKNDKLLLSGSNDATVRLWNLDNKVQKYKFEGHTNIVNSVLFSQDYIKAYSGSHDKTIRIWNLKTRKIMRTIGAFNSSIFQIILINKEEVIVTIQTFGTVSFYDLKKCVITKSVPKNEFVHDLSCICFTQDEHQFITGNEDGTIEVWLSENLKKILSLKKHEDHILNITISADSHYFATGSKDQTLIIWDLKKLCSLQIIVCRSPANTIYFSNNNSLIICCGFQINSCSLETFINKEVIEGKALGMFDLSTDLKYMVYGFISVHLFSLQEKKNLAKSFSFKKDICSLKFSPNSAFVAAGFYSGEIIMLNIPNLVQYKRFARNFPNIFCLSLSKDNKYIGFSDGKTKVMIVSVEKEKVKYETQKKEVHSLVFCCNDQKFIYTAEMAIYVLKRKFIFDQVIKLDHFVNVLILNDKDDYALVGYCGYIWSIIRLENLNKEYQSEGREMIKNWCAKIKDLKFRVFLSLNPSY